MINWIPYDRHDKSIPSHVPHLVTDGETVRISWRAHSMNGYVWFREMPRSPIDERLSFIVTHWAPINLPGEE